jgi:hypothetical protein
MAKLLIPFAIKNLLNEERGFGGGQPCGLAAALNVPLPIQKPFAKNLVV